MRGPEGARLFSWSGSRSSTTDWLCERAYMLCERAYMPGYHDPVRMHGLVHDCRFSYER